MAYANANVSTREEVKVIEELVSYTLVLFPDEAKALHDVLRRISGSADNTRRGLTESITEALREANVPYTGIMEPTDVEGGVHFLPYPRPCTLTS